MLSVQNEVYYCTTSHRFVSDREMSLCPIGNVRNRDSLDGTYVYIEKSSNYAFQRRTYSLHKGRPLVKPMMMVSTTKYILEVFGPYFADGKNNDASILNNLVKQTRSRLL